MTINREWCIGPFGTLKQMRQCWEVLRNAGETVDGDISESDFAQYDRIFLHSKYGVWDLADVDRVITNILPDEFLQLMGHNPAPNCTITAATV